MRHAVDDFQIGERAMRFSLFAPRLRIIASLVSDSAAIA